MIEMKCFVLIGKIADILNFLGALVRFEYSVPINLMDLLDGQIFRVGR